MSVFSSSGSHASPGSREEENSSDTLRDLKEHGGETRLRRRGRGTTICRVSFPGRIPFS